MAEFIVNPRRAPRAPARCRAAVVSPAGAFEAETEDIGSRGCQVVSPKLVRKGDGLALVISNGKMGEPLRVTGRVAWVSAQPPWRIGIAFEAVHAPVCERWFDAFVAAHPGVGSFRRVPERIAVDATIYLGPPPRFLVDFTADGATVDELMTRLRDGWPAAQRALFSLLARQAVTLSRGHAAHPDAWKKILTDVEASLAIESLGSVAPSLAAPPEPIRAAATPVPRPIATPVPIAPRPAEDRPTRTPLGTERRTYTPVQTGAVPATSAWGVPVQNPDRMLELDEGGPPLDIAAPSPQARGVGRTDSSAWGARDGAGWRGTARARTPEVQDLLDRARAELAAANVNGAIALLRQALAQAPGDAEIADALGKLAFKDRLPGAR
jgi:hypothetical protein